LLAVKFIDFKPVHYNRFRYVGKGFKMVLKKKKKLLKCIFGHSHLYLIKFQNTFIKKTKKYKFFYATQQKINLLNSTDILAKIKPINRYTLRGVRTYEKKWFKRKGRKSTATHI
jgi:hypothetical protein